MATFTLDILVLISLDSHEAYKSMCNIPQVYRYHASRGHKDYERFMDFVCEIKGESIHRLRYLNGKFHNPYHPVCEIVTNGVINTRKWGLDNEIMKVDMVLHNRRMVVWLKNNKQHRVGAPAYIEYDSLGNKKAEIWYTNGKINRLDEPAYIQRLSDGRTIELYFTDGKEIFSSKKRKIGVLTNTAPRKRKINKV